jgi:two-component system, OmpR family, response regulator
MWWRRGPALVTCLAPPGAMLISQPNDRRDLRKLSVSGIMMGVMSQPDPGAQAVTRSASVAPSAPVTLSGRRIVVVDDEKSITDLVSMALKLHGATVEVAHRGADGLRLVESFRPHLVVLDVMLPDLDGFEVLKRMGWDRQAASVPVLFLTARSELDDRLRGLAAGGDDYMAKPFSVEEMLLRIGAILRRTDEFSEVPPRLSVGDLTLDEESYEVWRGKSAMSLTPTEFRLLHYLMVNAGRVVSKSQIRDWVWDYHFEGKVNMVEVYISYLRKKLDAFGPPMIRTVRGVGYCLRASDPAEAASSGA